jgi:hypothetical protein
LNSGFALAKQALYHLSHTYTLIKMLLVPHAFCCAASSGSHLTTNLRLMLLLVRENPDSRCLSRTKLDATQITTNRESDSTNKIPVRETLSHGSDQALLPMDEEGCHERHSVNIHSQILQIYIWGLKQLS